MARRRRGRRPWSVSLAKLVSCCGERGQVVGVLHLAVSLTELQKSVLKWSALHYAVPGRSIAEPPWARNPAAKPARWWSRTPCPQIGDPDVRVMETKYVRPLPVGMARDTPQLARRARQDVASLVEQAINGGLRHGDGRPAPD